MGALSPVREQSSRTPRYSTVIEHWHETNFYIFVSVSLAYGPYAVHQL
jgi:hypothetical protein